MFHSRLQSRLLDTPLSFKPCFHVSLPLFLKLLGFPAAFVFFLHTGVMARNLFYLLPDENPSFPRLRAEWKGKGAAERCRHISHVILASLSCLDTPIVAFSFPTSYEVQVTHLPNTALSYVFFLQQHSLPVEFFSWVSSDCLSLISPSVRIYGDHVPPRNTGLGGMASPLF